MQDRPSAMELLSAVRDHLERAILPVLGDPKLKFQTLVAANVLAIVEREIAADERLTREAWASLVALGIRTNAAPPTSGGLRDAVRDGARELARQIRAGSWDGDERRRLLLDHLRRAVRSKLAVANPRYESAAPPATGE